MDLYRDWLPYLRKRKAIGNLLVLVFARTDQTFRGMFYFRAAGLLFADFVAGFFCSFLAGKTCPDKSSRKISSKPSKIYTTKIPDTFLQRGGANISRSQPRLPFAIGRASNLVPKSPESEILAKFFADMGEKCGEKMAKFFADFRPSIFRKSGRRKFHKKLATNSGGREIKFFHRETLGGWGRASNLECANGRGRSGGQAARGHPKACPRPRLPLSAVPALKELKSACRVSIFHDEGLHSRSRSRRSGEQANVGGSYGQ